MQLTINSHGLKLFFFLPMCCLLCDQKILRDVGKFFIVREFYCVRCLESESPSH